MQLKLSCIQEAKPGKKWQSFFEKVWPHYKTWFLSEGYLKRPGYVTSLEQLQTHMPELIPIYAQLCQLAGNGDLASRFLSMYSPPPYMSGCSQIALSESSTLIRNYDYYPEFFDGRLFYTQWLKPVIGMIDCVWGLLDGMNSDGLAVSLTFGGRKVIGKGFGISLLVRYLLETCSNVAEAIEGLQRIPVHMAYNLTLLDRSGNYVTAYLSPDRAPVFVAEAVCTNHQVVIEWAEYAQFTKTLERKAFLDNCLQNTHFSSAEILALFLDKPLYHTHFNHGFGTLYTAAYQLQSGQLHLLWPEKEIHLGFEQFSEQKLYPLEIA
jgi:predicted choloylglycine hydrolase